MKKRIVSALLIGAMAISSLTGCSSTKAESKPEEEKTAVNVSELTEPTTITFWHSMGGVNGEAIDTLVKKFNSENGKGITVDSQYQGSYDDSINKLKSAQIGNMGADLVQIYDVGTRFMIDSGWVVPIQEFMDADSWDSAQIEPNIAAYYSVENKLYSMPFNSSTPLLYYNKNMFESAGITEVPTTIEEIENIGEALTTKGGAKAAISLSVYGWFFEQFLCKQGLNYVDNGNGRTNAATLVEFDSNGGGLKMLQQWDKLAKSGYAPNVGRGGDAGLASFSAGEAAMTIGSTASLKQILIDVNGKFEVGTAYFPKVNKDDKGGVSIGGGSLWALKNNDSNKQAATWEFIKFLVSAESQAYWNSQTGYFPVTTAAQEQPEFKENIAKYPQFMTALDQLHESSPESAGALLSVFPEARQIVESEIQTMTDGTQTPEETISKIAKGVNKAIEEYNLVNN